MPKPELYGETIYVRVPRGTKDAIERVRRNGETQADWVRRVLLGAIRERPSQETSRASAMVRRRPE